MTQKNNRRSLKIENRALLYLQGETHHYLRQCSVFHYQVPGLNLNKSPWIEKWDVQNAAKLYQPFPWHCDYPKPLLPPAKLPRSVLCNGDPGLDFLLTKRYVAEDVNIMARHLKYDMKDFNVQKEFSCFPPRGSVPEVELPKYVADLAELMDMDPDPNFKGKYNYYFNSGSLNNITLNEKSILIFPYVGELVAAPLIPHENSVLKPCLKRAAKCKLDGQVFELRRAATDNGYRLMARLKYECVFFSVNEKDDKLTMQLIDTRESLTPYITADVNPVDSSQYCTVDIEGEISLYDLVSGKRRSHGTTPIIATLEDKWRSVRYHKWNPAVATIADRSYIHYFDFRKSIEKPVLSMCPKPYLAEYELISVEMPSEQEARHYVGTDFSLLMFDSRYPQEPIRQKWTHQLQSSPIIANVLPHDGKEVITLSTQLAGDIKIILNTWENFDEPHNFHLPYSPPSILDTLRECHLLGKCLDPMLKTRLKLSTTGCQLILDESQNVYFLTQNSVGDIFYQGVNYEEMLDNNSFVNTNAYYALEVWEKRMLSQNNFIPPLVICDQSNMKTVFESFSNKDLKYTPPVKRSWKDREDKCIFKKKKRTPIDEQDDSTPFWKQSIKQLSKYIDLLAPSLLAAWEVTQSHEPVPQPGSAQKVLSWLEKAAENITEGQLTPESNPDDEDSLAFTPVNSQDLVSVSQQVDHQSQQEDGINTVEDLVYVDDPVIDTDLSYLSVRPSKKRKDTKKKSNFTTGF